MPVVTRSLAKTLQEAVTEPPLIQDYTLKSVDWCVEVKLSSGRPMGHVEQVRFNQLTSLFQAIDASCLEPEEERITKIEAVVDYLTTHLGELLQLNPERWFKLALVVQIKSLFFEYKHLNVSVMYVHPLKPATIQRMLSKFKTLRSLASSKLKTRPFKHHLKQDQVTFLVNQIAKWETIVEGLEPVI